MRLLKSDSRGKLSLTDDLDHTTYPYAILSHTWGPLHSEVLYSDIQFPSDKNKEGFEKIQFCAKQAGIHGLTYFWVDTCCIDKTNNNELSEAINSMFRWYRNADRCYVYLHDVSYVSADSNVAERIWEPAFRRSRWFTRGWTLQELIAPASVEFYSREWTRLGDKISLESLIHEITTIPIAALRGTPLSHFSLDERLRWAANRQTTKEEDRAYCLLGIFETYLPLIYGEKENAFVRLKREIGISTTAPADANLNVHWLITRSINNLFTGRDDLLVDLEDTIRSSISDENRTTQCRIVISGIGGQGKSEICLQLAHRLRTLFWGVFWVDVSTTSIAEQDFVKISRQLKIPSTSWEDGRQALSSARDRWLLVLDNADDPSIDYQDFFPSGLSGVVIMTSRNDECQLYATASSVELERLPMDHAQDLVLKAAKVSDPNNPKAKRDARTVATLLHAHPLALIQAGAYLARGYCTLEEYPQVYGQHRKQLLAFRPSQARSRYCDVYTTFQASVEVLQRNPVESSQDALQLLLLLPVIAPNQFPLILFETAWHAMRRTLAHASDYKEDLESIVWYKSRLPSFMQRDARTWNGFRLMEAVHTLKTLALISVDVQDKQHTVSMHPLLHAWAVDRQDEQQQHDSWISMGFIFALVSSDREFCQINSRQLQPHLLAILSWDFDQIFKSEPAAKVTSIFVECGWLVDVQTDLSSLKRLTDRLCTHHGLDQAVFDDQWTLVYHLIGISLNQRGKSQAAFSMLENVLESYKRQIPEGSRHRAFAQFHMAVACLANGFVKTAIKLFEELDEFFSKYFPDDHSDRLTTQHELAGAYQADGQVQKAVTLLEHVVQVWEKLAEDHSSRLTAQHELARAYQANGQLDEAATMLEKVVRLRAGLPVDHPHLLASQHVLAMVYQAQGKVDKGVVLLEHTVRMLAQLAYDHPDQLSAQHNLATLLWEVNRYSEALELMRHVVEIRQRVLHKQHPDRKASEDWLAIIENPPNGV